MSTALQKLVVVVIGRNEGERLVACFESLQGINATLIYVDSGSSDDSLAVAQRAGAEIVELSTEQPFTAARARNTGFQHALARLPELEFVQFVDGDCQLDGSWIKQALEYLTAHPQVAVVCGRRREIAPEASPYNRLLDMEWNTPVGEASACGGDAMMRAEPFVAVKGFNSELIAGEEPDLCLRLRQRGHRIVRLDAEMTRHDAQITRGSAWWRRCMRAGHAYAEHVNLHRDQAIPRWRREVASFVFWGAALPAAVALAAWFHAGLAACLLLLYAVLFLRIYRYRRGQQDSPSDARLYAKAYTLAKFAELAGAVQYAWSRLRRSRTPLIEYKGESRT